MDFPLDLSAIPAVVSLTNINTADRVLRLYDSLYAGFTSSKVTVPAGEAVIVTANTSSELLYYLSLGETKDQGWWEVEIV